MNQLNAEFALLYLMVDYLEENGITHKIAMFTIDDAMVIDVNSNFKTKFSLGDLQKATDLCFSHEWITHRAMGEKYGHLGITPKGIGVARSKRKSDELKAKRSILKKASDYVEDHKGIFVLLGAVVGLTMLGLKIFGV
ncbi:MAG: hypothetical protein CL578_23795 [Alteromonadaceae bacterium]|uniref:hypothetical protein n=1 Tax=Paraglaciecola chathamensis TaxID=368405 RepID=UPI000C588BC3|nr:hypothetical protein [Paraglaciecola agarilytica]MBN28043.1 hypothetical protein [Alteromonadaceae bacterium]|tara:strand:+ start:55190 stop:55603 length:414 start_codon:yes stop_codon:yes gene_type:complete